MTGVGADQRLVPAQRSVSPRPEHVEALAVDFDRALDLLNGGEVEAAKGALLFATHQLRNLGASLGPVSR